MIKLLLNTGCWVAALAASYGVFYFRAFPRLIDHYRRAVVARREYDKRLGDIRKEGHR